MADQTTTTGSSTNTPASTPTPPPYTPPVIPDVANKNVNSPVLDSKYDVSAIKDDIGLMLNYAVKTGRALPNSLSLTNPADDSTMIDTYNNLQKVIQPATVESIKYINSQMIMEGKIKKWYQIPIFTKCVVIAAIALIALIVISLSPIVNEANQAKGLLESNGWTLLYNLIFICAASLLGVMFYLLKTFGDKIRNYTLIPANAIELNASIIIGVISGFVISELFTYTIDSIGSQNVEIHKMTLALLGGFSSDAIFSTLQGIVNKFKQLVSG